MCGRASSGCPATWVEAPAFCRTDIVCASWRKPRLTFSKTWSVAQISLDSMDEQTHNRRRASSRAWHDAITAIVNWLNMATPIRSQLRCTQDNLCDVRAVAEFCERQNAQLIIRPMVNAGRAACTLSRRHAEIISEQMQRLEVAAFWAIGADRFHYVTDGPMRLPAVSSGLFTCTQRWSIAGGCSSERLARKLAGDRIVTGKQSMGARKKSCSFVTLIPIARVRTFLTAVFGTGKSSQVSESEWRVRFTLRRRKFGESYQRDHIREKIVKEIGETGCFMPVSRRASSQSMVRL